MSDQIRNARAAHVVLSWGDSPPFENYRASHAVRAGDTLLPGGNQCRVRCLSQFTTYRIRDRADLIRFL